MKKGVKSFYFIISFLVIISAIFLTTAAVDKTKQWQSESQIRGIFGSQERTLQQAIDQSLLTNNKNSPRSLTDSLTKLDPGHKISEIWISVKEGGVRKEMTLKDAFSSARNLCGDADFSGYVGNVVNPGHPATEIEVTTSTGTKSLQDAINAKEILYTANYGAICNNNNLYYTDSCGRTGSVKQDCGNAYEPWSDWTCIDGNTRQKTRVVHKLGCSNTACTTQRMGDTTETVTRDCTGTYNLCDGGDCVTDWSGALTAYEWGNRADDDNLCPSHVGPDNYYDTTYSGYQGTYPGGYDRSFVANNCPTDATGGYRDYKMISCRHSTNTFTCLGWIGHGAPCQVVQSQYRDYTCTNSTSN